MRPPVALALPIVLAAVLGACGGSGSSQRAATSEAPPLTSSSTTTPTSTAPATTAQTTTAQTQTTTAPTSTAPAPTTTSPPQATGGAPAGCAGPAGGFIRDVQASGTDCGRARDVASSWFQAVHGGAAPDSQIAATGYTCSGSLAGERATVTCSGPGGRKIAFTASP
jgi:hypothetical protein